MESVGSGSRSSGGRGGLADEGDDKPSPSMMTHSARLDLCLNTPQAEEGPDQAESSGGGGGGGVAMLPQRRATAEASKLASGAATSSTAASTAVAPRTVRANARPPSESSVVGWSEDGPVRASSSDGAPRPPTARRASPQGASAPNSNSRRAQGSASDTRPTASPTPRRSAPPSTNTGANVAAGVPATAGPSANGASLSEDKTTSSEGCTKKQKLIIGAILGVIIVAVVVVALVLLLGGGDGEGANPTSPATGESTQSSPAESPTSAPVEGEPVLTLETIAQRGTLKCGISMKQGFGSVTNGEYEGFDADLCRAVAAGIFGPNGAVEYTVVDPLTRFETLQNQDIDVLAGSTSHTMDRDVYHEDTGVGYSFSTPYYYAGLGFAGIPPFSGCADQLNATEECGGMKVCVLDGTTHVDRVLELLPFANVLLSPNADAYYATFADGLCNILAGEPAEIAEAVVRNSGYVGEYEVGTNVYSKEPLALVTRDGDAQFSDFVNWIVQSLIAAEEQGITQSTASAFTENTLFGEEYRDMFIDAVGAVGNYEEMYNRNLEHIIPRASANTINGGDTGLIYGFPFGSFSTNGPDPVSGGTLETIVQRGHLRCGITRRAVFAEFDSSGQEWRGLDVDFCKAVSAAIFSGVTNTIVYQPLPATERFQTLQSGGVDVLARITTITMERDVFEPNAEAGFSFTQPNFYDGLSFGGIPPYGACADNLDVTSAGCESLLICVNDGTTFLERLKDLFPERYIAPQQTGELAIQGLASGACNTIAGGVQDVSPTSVVEVGEYTGPYEYGVNRFSKDPLALVTRQDDPQWSAFVYWIVSAIFYAEEEGITMASSTRMPIVNLFGPLYSRMFRDAIESVGSYSQIYTRNAEDQIPRGGLNLLNANPLGPQHYPLPGP